MPARKYHPGEEPSAGDRLKASRRALVERGGRIVQIRLEPEEAAALARLRAAHNLPTDRDAIAFAIQRALKAPPKRPD